MLEDISTLEELAGSFRFPERKLDPALHKPLISLQGCLEYCVKGIR